MRAVARHATIPVNVRTLALGHGNGLWFSSRRVIFFSR
jgi:hypothetical protein